MSIKVLMNGSNPIGAIASGHVILNESGTTMANENKLQFTGSGVNVSDDSTNGKTVVNILEQHDFTITTTWEANADLGDYETYPYKQVISTTIYNNNSAPDGLILAGDPTDFMTAAETEDKYKLCDQMLFTSTGITLLAKEETENALTLRVRGK